MAQNQSTNDALCKKSQFWRPAGPVTASITPVPNTDAVSAMTTGPSRRSSGTGGPLRRYGALPV